MPTVRAAKRRPDAKSSLGEIQTIAHRAAHAVVLYPAQVLKIYSPLQHEVFDQATDGVVGERRYDCGIQAKATPKPAGDVVFAAALPRAKLTRGGNAQVSGIQPEHDFTQTDKIPSALVLCFDLHASYSSPIREVFATAISSRFGSTSSQAKPPARLSTAATRKEDVQP